MRFLFCVRPYVGHLHPMLPFAGSLAGSGHEVVFATAPEFRATVRKAGFRGVTAGQDPALPAPDSVAPSERGPYGLWATREKTEDLLALCAEQPPDVIVREPTDFAGLLAGEVLGIPHAVIGFSLFYPRAVWQELVGSALAALRAQHGLVPDPGLDRLYPYLYLDTVPPLFQTPHAELPPTLVSIGGWRGERGQAPFPARWFDEPDRPLIYATLGTYYNRHARFFSVVADALREQAVNVLCTVGADQSPDAVLPSPPGNVRVVGYVDQATVQPHCAAVICHGGFGTVMGALCTGVPVLTVPHGADHFGNGCRARDLGMGIVLKLEQLTPEAIRDAVRRLLDEPRYATAARGFRDAADALPAPDHGGRLLAGLSPTARGSSAYR